MMLDKGHEQMKTKSDKNSLQIIQKFLIDELGDYVESLGGRNLLGRIWGLLLTSEEPVSLKEISSKLHVSKPSISSTVNIGLQFEIFRKYFNPNFPRENFIHLGYDSMGMLINPGKRKLEKLYEKFSKSVKLINEIDDKKENNPKVDLIHERMKFISECFKIFIDEYDKLTEVVINKIENLRKKYKVGELG